MDEIKCMIVDDEPLARDIIKSHIGATRGLTMVKSCINAAEAYEGLQQHEIDLMFLDIRMPVITGTDFLRSLRKPPLVVFTTAYHDYAVEGFDLNSVDYLLKPVTYDRFHQAIEKAKDRLKISGDQATQPAPDYIFIKQDFKLIKVNFDDIRYIEAQKDFSTIFLTDKKLLAGMHLKMFEAILPDHLFVRIHRSFIINLSKVTSLTGNILELGKSQVPIGSNYKENLLTRLRING
jgi:two-component system, LytTR family, response regulator